jgi:hypothetical protein
MDRRDNGIRRRRQKAVDLMGAGDRFGFRAPIGPEFRPDTGEGKKRAVLIERELHHVLFSWFPGLALTRTQRICSPEPGIGFPA